VYVCVCVCAAIADLCVRLQPFDTNGLSVHWIVFIGLVLFAMVCVFVCVCVLVMCLKCSLCCFPPLIALVFGNQLVVIGVLWMFM